VLVGDGWVSIRNESKRVDEFATISDEKTSPRPLQAIETNIGGAPVEFS
jgi:hypothetical protein